MTNSTVWQPSRTAALDRLESFIPHAGRDYASRRNYDYGQSNHHSVSTLSPWLRHRTISEAEVVSAVLELHSRTAAEKFIQEVFWRTYWKGWLEARPQVWQQYRTDLAGLYKDSPETVIRCEKISQGTSGIECFDAWCNELINTGYLHNHSRMWFASIWIFTLDLPWQLGADFFLRHLLDGDPASNTLSWRWVAGLQTVGKTYLARPDNIEKYTNSRFAPTGLTRTAEALTEEPQGEKSDLPSSSNPLTDKVTGLLLTEEDLSADALLEITQLHNIDVSSVATLQATTLRSARPASTLVTNFVQQLIEDSVANCLKTKADTVIGHTVSASTEAMARQLVNWATEKKLQQIITLYPPVGPTSDVLSSAEPLLQKNGIALTRMVRPWDQLVWPHASKGFFALKKKIPKMLDALLPDSQSEQKAGQEAPDGRETNTGQLSLSFSDRQ